MSYLYIRADAAEGLESFALRLFSRLNIKFLYIGQSASYVSECYIEGEVLGLTVKLAFADDVEFDDYRFWITFDTPPGLSEVDRDGLDAVSEVVAGILALDGMEVARPLGGGKIGEPRRLYRREVASAGGSSYVLRVLDE